MIYEYSQTNRIENPHTYMYTEYEGEPFLEEYLKKRLSHINLDLYIKVQNLELLKYVAKKEKLDYKKLYKKYMC